MTAVAVTHPLRASAFTTYNAGAGTLVVLLLLLLLLLQIQALATFITFLAASTTALTATMRRVTRPIEKLRRRYESGL